LKLLLLALTLVAATAAAQTTPAAHPPSSSEEHGLGYTTNPVLPGLTWRVHDINRPHPPQVTPSSVPGGPPSDAIILFDGHDLTQWHSQPGGYQRANKGDGPARWRVSDGYVEVTPRSGNIVTNESFGDIQLHVEWASPNPPTSSGQGRGNSGVVLEGFYEIQVLDAWKNPTYADGQAGAIYGQWPPLADPARPPGEWNTYDIVFNAPRWDAAGKLLSPGFITLFMNGVLMQNHQQVLGVTEHMKLPHDTPHGDLPLLLQNHNDPVRYRNIWVRRIPHADALVPGAEAHPVTP
jgi:hypothetical protein